MDSAARTLRLAVTLLVLVARTASAADSLGTGSNCLHFTGCPMPATKRAREVAWQFEQIRGRDEGRLWAVGERATARIDRCSWWPPGSENTPLKLLVP
jgi:hypothetical protein